MTSVPRVLVLYGSETGTAQDVAEQIQQLAWNRALGDAQCCALDAFPVAQLLPRCDVVVFVVATAGDGDAPDNMRGAWRALLRKTLPADWLRGVQVAVFGLGDSSYAKYNAVARRLQARLLQLGASEIVERGLGDDQHALGYFGALNPWLEKLWSAVLQRFPLPQGFVIDDSPRAIVPRYRVTTITASASVTVDPRSDASTFYAPPPTALHASEGICMARLVENRRLTSPEWTQDVRHLVLDLGDSQIQYPAGAIALVYPENTKGVEELIQYVGLADDTVLGISVPDGSVQTDLPSCTTLRDLFSKFLDVQGTPRRSFFSSLSLYAASEEEKEKLAEIASPDGADLLYDYCIREKKSYAEVLLDFPSVRVPLDVLVQLLPRQRPRAYSIASSSLLHPGQVHLTVAIVDFVTPYKRRRSGVCSSYFQALDPTKDDAITLPIWIKTGLFNPPAISKSMLLIGPGTGLAAMRAIAQERQAQRAQHREHAGYTIGHTSLYFGSRHKDKDYLYGDELQAMVASGALTALHTAFSRDQSHKIYVQTRLAEQKEQVFSLLTSGAYVYVAGSAKRMPTDVYEVLRDILRDVGKLSLPEAESAMKVLVRTKRYVVESWS